MDDLDIGSKEVMRIVTQATGRGSFKYWDSVAGQWKNGFWDGNRTLVTVADDGVVTNVQRFGSKEAMGRYVNNLKSRSPDPGEWIP